MKIILVNSCEYMGGAEWWHLRGASALASRGHQVRLLVRRGPLAERARAEGLAVDLLPMSFDLDLYSAVRAFFYFRRLRPDLILLNDQRECRLIAPAAAAAGVQFRVQRKGWPFLKGSWRDRLIYRRFVTHLIAVSEEVAGVFRARSGLPVEKIRILVNGVDVKKFSGGDRASFRAKTMIRPEEVMVGSAGRLVSQKNFPLLIEAVSLLPEPRPGLIIAGAGENHGQLFRDGLDRGLTRWLLGPCDDMPSFYAGLDLFVFPSNQEGRSNAVLEAMAAGLPVIASDIPGNRELIEPGRTGVLFPAGDAAALASAIQGLLADPDRRQALGAAAQAWVHENLDADIIWGRLEENLRAAINGTW